MRQVSETFAARLAADVTSLCVCWRLQRRDGTIFGATDHDRELDMDGVLYQPTHGLRGARFESSASLAPGRAAASGALDAAFVTEADLSAGLWDGARVDVWRVDWQAPEHRVRVWSGRLSEIRREGAAFTAELVSLKADLEQTAGRVYSRSCDAEAGDGRCGVDLSGAAFHGEGVVAERDGARIWVSGLSGFDSGWFAGGVLTWTSGANVGMRARVASHGAGSVHQIGLVAPIQSAIEAGDAFVITAGCDKTFATCGAKFANRENFRGHPHMPGNDFVLAGPASDRANDGGRR